jgi:hypothetical protein
MFDWLVRKQPALVDWKSAEDTLKIPYGPFRCIWPDGHETRALRHRAFGELWTVPADAVLLQMGFVYHTDPRAATIEKKDCVIPTAEDYAKSPVVRRQVCSSSAASDLSSPIRGGVARLANGDRVAQVGDFGGNLPGESADAVQWDGPEPYNGPRGDGWV